MINFFRKIRRNLADNNQFFKYSRYAIGEIVLVVVGILIALSINNWNETRKEKKQEQHILEIILKDFYLAKNKSNELIEKEEVIFNTLEHFLSNQRTRNELINHPKIDSIFGVVIWASVDIKVPVINAYTDLKNAGKTNIITRESIRTHFTSLESQFDRLNTILEDRLSVQITNIDGYVLKNMNFIPLLTQNGMNYKIEYEEPNNYREIFKDRFILNAIAAKLELTTTILKERRLLLKEIDELIMLIEDELNH